MSNFYERGVQNFGRTNAIHLSASSIQDLPNVKVKDIAGFDNLIDKESARCEMQARACVQIQPNTSVNSNLLNAGIVEFELSKDVLSRLDQVNLKITVSNTTGGNVVFAPTRAWVQQVEVYGDNGGNLIYLQRYEDSFAELAHYNSQDWSLIAPSECMNDTYAVDGSAASATLANNASQSFVHRLQTLVQGGALHLSGLKSKILLRYTFQQSSYTIISGALPNVTQSILLLEGVYEPKSVMDLKYQLYMKSPLTVKFIDHFRNTQQMTLAANSQYKIVLSALRGLAAWLWVGIRPAARTAANQYDFSATNALTNFDVQDQNGMSLIGFYQRQVTPFDDTTSIIYPESGFDNYFPRYTGLKLIPFAENVNLTFKTGANTGFQVFTSFEQLLFTTSASFTPGNYEILILAGIYNQCYIRGGSIIRAN